MGFILGHPHITGESEVVSFGCGVHSVLELIHPCCHLGMGELPSEDCPSIISMELERVVGLQALLGFVQWLCRQLQGLPARLIHMPQLTALFPLGLLMDHIHSILLGRKLRNVYLMPNWIISRQSWMMRFFACGSGAAKWLTAFRISLNLTDG